MVPAWSGLPALIALGVGGVLPVVGWLVGVILVVASGAWTRRDKLVGLLLGVLPVVLLLAVLLVAADGNASTSPPMRDAAGIERGNGGLGPLETTVLGFGVIAGVPSALYLAWRLRRTPQDRTLRPVDPVPGQARVVPAQQ
jgi:hypothetical protein